MHLALLCAVVLSWSLTSCLIPSGEGPLKGGLLLWVMGPAHRGAAQPSPAHLVLLVRKSKTLEPVRRPFVLGPFHWGRLRG